MARSIHRTFIAGVAAAAVFITMLGASQAQAGSRDTERALAALLGLAVVGAIIADRRDDRRDDRKSQAVTRTRPHQGFGRDDTYRWVEPRPVPKRVQRQLLPRECLREVWTNRGPTDVFNGQCLHHNYAFARNLPRGCAQKIRGGRGSGRSIVWNAHCLERNGYRVSRR